MNPNFVTFLDLLIYYRGCQKCKIQQIAQQHTIKLPFELCHSVRFHHCVSWFESQQTQEPHLFRTVAPDLSVFSLASWPSYCTCFCTVTALRSLTRMLSGMNSYHIHICTYCLLSPSLNLCSMLQSNIFYLLYLHCHMTSVTHNHIFFNFCCTQPLFMVVGSVHYVHIFMSQVTLCTACMYVYVCI